MRIAERVLVERAHVRGVRRAVSVDRAGQVAGDVGVQGYSSFSIAASADLEELWRRWAG